MTYAKSTNNTSDMQLLARAINGEARGEPYEGHDGTLVSFKTHEIPVSTIEALTAAKAKGIHIFISTGQMCIRERHNRQKH